MITMKLSWSRADPQNGSSSDLVHGLRLHLFGGIRGKGDSIGSEPMSEYFHFLKRFQRCSGTGFGIFVNGASAHGR